MGSIFSTDQPTDIWYYYANYNEVTTNNVELLLLWLLGLLFVWLLSFTLFLLCLAVVNTYSCSSDTQCKDIFMSNPTPVEEEVEVEVVL